MQPPQNEHDKKSLYRRISQGFIQRPVTGIIYSLSIAFVSLFPPLGGHLANINFTFWLGVLTVFLILCATTVRGLSLYRLLSLTTFSLIFTVYLFVLGILAIRDGGLNAFMGIGNIVSLLCLWIIPQFRHIRLLSTALENANHHVSLLFFKGEAV